MASPCPRKVQILSGRRVPAQGGTASKKMLIHPPWLQAEWGRTKSPHTRPRHTSRFHSAVGFDTRPLASTLHSMVRVSRRVVAVGVRQRVAPLPSSVVGVRGAAQELEQAQQTTARSHPPQLTPGPHSMPTHQPPVMPKASPRVSHARRPEGPSAAPLPPAAGPLPRQKRQACRARLAARP